MLGKIIRKLKFEMETLRASRDSASAGCQARVHYCVASFQLYWPSR
jgi:hypothetical protein